MKQASRMNIQFDNLVKSIKNNDSENLTVIENMYMLLKKQDHEASQDRSKVIREYRRESTNPQRLVAKLERERLSRRKQDHPSTTIIPFDVNTASCFQ